jgi:hypothetical protein
MMLSIAILCQKLESAPAELLTENDHDDYEFTERDVKKWLAKHKDLTDVLSLLILDAKLSAEPAHRHFPGDEPPDCEKLAYHLAHRFDHLPTRRARFVAANRKARKLYGGRCGTLPKQSAATHDFLLAQLFFKFDDREQRHLWIPEWQLKRTMKRYPDAALRDGPLIDMGGKYQAHRLRTAHEAWKDQPYIIW